MCIYKYTCIYMYKYIHMCLCIMFGLTPLKSNSKGHSVTLLYSWFFFFKWQAHGGHTRPHASPGTYWHRMCEPSKFCQKSVLQSPLRSVSPRLCMVASRLTAPPPIACHTHHSRHSCFPFASGSKKHSLVYGSKPTNTTHCSEPTVPSTFFF